MGSKAATRRSNASAIGRSAAAGRAFSIQDDLLALRWAGLVRERGYRLTIAHTTRNADEIIEIRIPPHRPPLYRFHRGACGVWAIDCVGRSRVFTTLADALLAVTPLSSADRRFVLKPRTPGWLPVETRPSPFGRLLDALGIRRKAERSASGSAPSAAARTGWRTRPAARGR